MQHSRKEKEMAKNGNGGANAEEVADEPLKLEGKTPTIAQVVGFKDSKKTKSEILAQIRKMTHLKLDGKKLELVDNLDEC